MKLKSGGQSSKLVSSDAPAFVKTHLFVALEIFRRPVKRARRVASLPIAQIIKDQDDSQEGFSEGTQADE